MAKAGGFDPISQFEIQRIVPIKIGGLDMSFTNASLFMVIAVAVIGYVMVYGTRHAALIPDRLQSLAETIYEFLANIMRQSVGEEGMKFFPFVFSLFMFILICNMVGLIPFTFTVTSQIIITIALALIVFFTVIIYGVITHGLHFLHLFKPSGVPWYLLILVTPIEIISFISRPISHSIRLFANMLAGHIALKVFGGFVAMMLGAGWLAVLAPLPFVMSVAITALELLVAFLQAYVFTLLTCMYLNDALHPGH